MTDTFRCDDKETLVAYLYGEIDTDLRREVERHLRTCSACALETEGLQAVRHDLQSWQPPESELGFAIVPHALQKPASVVRPSRWAVLGSMPAWAQVAAAVLVIAVGAGIANVRVRYGNDGLVVTTGWMSPVTPATTPVPAAVTPAEDWRPALAALEQNLRSELAQLNAVAAPTAAVSRDNHADTQVILRRVQALLEQSEQRQREEMALRLTQTYRDWDMQRRGDILRIEQRLGTLQGRTFKTEAGQTEVMNYLRRVSAQQIP
jgi:Putative zinc-finger